jgi:hypothetical protein
MNAMTMISHTGPAGSLVGTFHEAAIAFVQAWTSGYKRRRQHMRDMEELRSLDPSILADLGIEFAPEFGRSILHSQAEAVVAATSAITLSRKVER